MSDLVRELFLPRIFTAYCYADQSPTIYTLAVLGRLRDDCSRFNRETTPISQNADVEIRSAQFDLRCLVVQPYDHGHCYFEGRESRSRLTDNASCERAIAGSTMKQTIAIAGRVAISSRLLPCV